MPYLMGKRNVRWKWEDDYWRNIAKDAISNGLSDTTKFVSTQWKCRNFEWMNPMRLFNDIIILICATNDSWCLFVISTLVFVSVAQWFTVLYSVTPIVHLLLFVTLAMKCVLTQKINCMIKELVELAYHLIPHQFDWNFIWSSRLFYHLI
jgi:hypothetical protein